MEIRRGTLRGFDDTDYKATVEISGSVSVWLTGVPVSRNIADADLVEGRGVAVLFLDPSNPEDAVLFAVWA
ncbi:MAG: hypothetical protein GEU75_15730 [Dehalococcoidia bacterium]|nr:hypothetical protein [Dehalococcoidia bacterium]